jgi:hypothetical protein
MGSLGYAPDELSGKSLRELMQLEKPSSGFAQPDHTALARTDASQCTPPNRPVFIALSTM